MKILNFRHEFETNKIDYFDENGKSMRKTLMKTPIIATFFLEKKHPILGLQNAYWNDFAALTGTPILASGMECCESSMVWRW